MAFTPEFACGFEMGVVPLRAGEITAVAASAVTSQPHTGTYGCLLQTNHRVYVVRASPSDTIDVGVWWRPASANGSGQIQLYRAGSVWVDLRYAVGGHWDAYLDNALVASGTVLTALSNYQHVQLSVTLGTTGSIRTIIEGIPDIEYSGDLGAGTLDALCVMCVGSGTHYVDDLVFGEGGWPGDLRIDPLVVDGDDAVAWVPSGGGDNYADVDGIPPDAPYVYTDVDGRDLYTLADWDDTDGAGTVVKDPLAVTVWAQVRKEDASVDDQFRLLQSDGANEVDSGYGSILSSYEHHGFMRLAAPGGGLWSKAEVDALRVGIEADLV